MSGKAFLVTMYAASVPVFLMAQDPAAKPIMTAACNSMLGKPCDMNTYFDMESARQKQHISSQTEYMQFLSAKMNTLPAMRQDAVDLAYYKVFGRKPDSTAESNWLAAWIPDGFSRTLPGTGWTTEPQLEAKLHVNQNAANRQLPAVAAPAYTPAQQQQALQSAFQAIWLRTPSASEAQMFSSTAPAAMAGAVRIALQRSPAEVPRIVALVFATVTGRAPTDYEKAGIVSVFESYWSGADDLSKYLQSVSAYFRIPNYGPGVPQNGASQNTSRLVNNLPRLGAPNNSPALPVSATPPPTAILDSSGHLVASGAGNLVASGAGNLVASGAGNLGAPGSASLVSTNGSNIQVNAGGNAIAVPRAYSAGPAAQAPDGICSDASVTAAVRAVTGRAPNGTGNTGECAVTRYGGRWSSYRDLVMKVGTSLQWPRGTCRDPWITQATLDIRGVLPAGTGDLGQCSPRNYNGGQWQDYATLVAAVKRYYGL